MRLRAFMPFLMPFRASTISLCLVQVGPSGFIFFISETLETNKKVHSWPIEITQSISYNLPGNIHTYKKPNRVVFQQCLVSACSVLSGLKQAFTPHYMGLLTLTYLIGVLSR